ncbi:MAG: hypothetical protein ACKO5M_03825, partial [Vulcanococcus sp.]
FLFTWVLGWGVGGSLIDAGLINAGVYSLEGGQLGTAATFILWSMLWGAGGVWLYRRWIRPAYKPAVVQNRSLPEVVLAPILERTLCPLAFGPADEQSRRRSRQLWRCHAGDTF